jgi:hypothetical protein
VESFLRDNWLIINGLGWKMVEILRGVELFTISGKSKAIKANIIKKIIKACLKTLIVPISIFKFVL